MLKKRIELLMGNRFELTVEASTEVEAEYFLQIAVDEIKRIESLLSTYKPDSETNLINQFAGIQAVKVSEETFRLIQRSIKISELTQGAFDISYGSIDKRFWNFDTEMTSLPDPEIAKNFVKLINYKNIILDETDFTVFLKNEGMRIGFGGIGKGYAAEQAKNLLKSYGVKAGIVKWPMSVIRLNAKEPERLIDLADKILGSWRGYTDEAAMILAETDGEPHNTITPIARRRGEDFELDLVLRNNLTTPDHPLGIYHPHEEFHHIKKENIGLIEVMGLAILPGRLKKELEAVEEKLLSGEDMTEDPLTKSHAKWAADIAANYEITAENVKEIVQKETGIVFSKVLEQAGVYKRTPEGKEAFLRFINQV